MSHFNVSNLKLENLTNFIMLFPFLISILYYYHFLGLTRSREKFMQRAYYRTPFHRRVCHQWMASKYPCTHDSHEQQKKALKPPFQFALRMIKLIHVVTSFLSSHQMPGY